MSSDCIFCKIIAGDIPSKTVYRDDKYIVFFDVNPKYPLHLLVCPVEHTETFQVTNPDIIAGACKVVQELATKLGIENNYSLQINNGDKSGQEVFHLHLHLLSANPEAKETAENFG